MRKTYFHKEPRLTLVNVIIISVGKDTFNITIDNNIMTEIVGETK